LVNSVQVYYDIITVSDRLVAFFVPPIKRGIGKFWTRA